MAKKREDYLINLVVTSENLAGGDLENLSEELGKMNREITNLGKSEEKRAEQIKEEGKATATLTDENKKAVKSAEDLAKATREQIDIAEERVDSIDKESRAVSGFVDNWKNALKQISGRQNKLEIDIDTTKVKNNLTAVERSILNLGSIKNRIEAQIGREVSKETGPDPQNLERLTKQYERVLIVERRLAAVRKQLAQEAKEIGVSAKALKNAQDLAKQEKEIEAAREKAEKQARSMLNLQAQAIKENERRDREAAKAAKDKEEAERKSVKQRIEAEKLEERVEKRKEDAQRKLAKDQISASKFDKARDRLRVAAQEKFVKLLEKEDQVKARSKFGDERGRVELEKWVADLEEARDKMIEYGMSEEETYQIQNKAAKSGQDRLLRIKKARNDYAKIVEKENNLLSENTELTQLQQTELELLVAKKNELEKELKILGGTYEDLRKSQQKTTNETEENVRGLARFSSVLKRFREGERDRSPFIGFGIAIRDTAQEAAVLSRKLGRLGLAIRGLVIVGILAFFQSFVSVIGALGAQLVALVGSIASAAAAIGVTLVSAVAQAIPVVGLLAAVFSRFSAIQEAVNQADLAQKNSFGDTGAENAATDAALQIADAQRQVKEAQEGVTEARREAKKELQDLILKEKEAELAFKGAALSQLEARRALRETIEAGDVESVARDQLGIEESALDVIRARRDLRGARRERRQGLRGGPEGTETYKNAVDALAAAQRGLAQAQRSAASSADTQSAAQRNLAFFLNELSAAERKLFQQFMKARERYKRVFRPITDIIIEAFSRAFTRVEKLLFSGEIVSGFRSLAKVVGGSFDRLSKTLTSPVFKEFFVEMIRQAANNMPLLTDGLILLADIFRNIALAAGPVFRALLSFIVEKLGEFNQKVSDTGALTEFLMMGEQHFEAWIELIISILGLFGELIGASANSALETITSLTETINGAKESLAADDSGARRFFDDAAQSAKEMGRVIVELGAAIVELTNSGQVKALADIFTEMLIPGFVEGVKIVGVFALGLDKLLEIPVIAEMLQLGVAIFFVVSAFTAVRAIFQPAIVLFYRLGQAVAFAIGQLGLSGSIFAIIRKALAAIPGVGWIVLGVIEVIVGAFMALKDNFWGVADAMKEALSGLGEAFNNLFAAFGGDGEGGGGFGLVLDVLGKIVNVILDIIGFISKVIGAIALFAVIEAIIKPLTFIVNTIADIINVWSTFVNDIKNNGIGPALVNLGKNILRGMGRIIGRLAALLLRLPILAVKGLIAAVKAIWSGIKRLTKLAVKGIIGLGKLIWNTLKFIFSPSSVINALGNVVSAMGDFFKSLPGAIWNILKAAGKAIWEGLVEGIGTGTAEKVVNFFIGVINSIIDMVNSTLEKINSVSGLIGIEVGLIDRVEEVDLKEKTGPGSRSKSDSAGRGRSRDIDAETESQKKNNKSKKDAAKFNLGNYKALNLSGGASKRNTRLNNQLADSLGRSSRQHKRAQNLQEALAKASARGRRQQELYANAVRQTARVEERYANSLARARRIKADSNDKDRASVKIRGNLVDATQKVSRVQGKYYNSTIKATAAHKLFNRNVKTGNELQQRYEKRLNMSSDAIREQRQATTRLTTRFGSFNRVLKTTGENSRALGLVFKRVTNKLLTEFNAKPLKVELPAVGGMFKEAMGNSTQGFQRGGYFGNKRLRRKDDRTIMVAGGEAILTGYHQPEVNKALAFAKAHGVSQYDSLDSMFSREKRPHYSAPTSQMGGPGGDSNYQRRRRRRQRESAGRTPMGYAWRGHSPQGLKEAVRKIAGATMYKYPFLSASSTLRDDPGSHHGAGEAVDLATLPYSRMNEPATWVGSTYGRSLQEGIFNPTLSIQSGQRVPPSFWGSSTWNAHADHIHIAALGGEVTAGGLPGGMLTAPQIKKVKIKAPKNSIGALLRGQAETLRKGANKKIKKEFAAGNMMGMDGGVLTRQQVAEIAKRALQILNMPTDQESIRRLVWLAYKESGFNPRSINDWDSNAAAGDPSRGLMQTIGATFNSYKLPRYGNIWNPLHNMIASIRYQMARYGQLVTWTPYNMGGMVPNFDRGGMLPEFDRGGIVPGPIGSPQIIKAHGGETILPTHKFNNGGFVPRYQSGGIVDGIPTITTAASIRGKNPTGLNRQINRLTKELAKTEDAEKKSILQEKIAELKDQLLLSKEVRGYNKEIKSLNKKISQKKKEIRKADEDDRKELRGELKDLQKDLAKAKNNKKQTVAFEGELYNMGVVNEFVLLLSDRINSFMKKIESEVSRMAIATAKWTYKLVKVDGKMIVSRVNSAVDEAVRGLENLVNETGFIMNAMAEAKRTENKARARLKRVRDNDRAVNKAEKALDKARDIDDKDKRKEAVKEAKKDLAKAKKKKKEDIQKLQASIRKSNATQAELAQRLAENLQARYEQQAAIFEEEQAVFDAQNTAIDTQIEIATLQNTDAQGNLTDAGKEIVRGFYQQRAQTLEQQRANIQEELNAARAAKDIERSRELEQALLENQLALLQNTNSIKELDESVQDGLFDFSSTNWEQFRQAIFSNGSILPQFQSQIPQLATGGYVSREGLAYLHAAEVVVPASKTGNTGPLVDTINFTQPMEAADPVAISNQIGFKLSTLKSL